MEPYKLDASLDANKVFVVKRSELEGKLEVSYHLPVITDLESRVRSKSNKKLKDFIIKLSSGATPSVTEEDKYYSDAENGIPFLRVQNLQDNGRLNLSDVKYINKETHEGYLKRSQVGSGDLLVKITGVGRMAIASVADEDFVGNTNQHMVVIKTKDRETSEYLANYLNLDFVEKLATRRATGGTRPALDYPALKSIPIIEGIDFSLLRDAEKEKQAKEAEVKELLASIDTYLLKELGITLPEKDNSLEARIFTTNFSEVVGGRLDPFSSLPYFKESLQSITNGKFETSILNKVISFLESGSRPSGGVNNIEDGILSLGGEHVNSNCEIEIKNPKYIPLEFHNKILSTKTKLLDILLVKDGATTGKVGIIEDDKYIDQNINEHVFLIRTNKNINPNYLVYILYSSIGQIQISNGITGATVTGITKDVVRKLQIPLPPLEKQNEIAEHTASIRANAKALQQEAEQILAAAKQQVEEIILG